VTEGQKRTKEMAEMLGYDYDKLVELLNREDDSFNYTDDEKRMLADISFLRILLYETDITTSVIFMIVLNALTGLNLKEAQDIVEYVSKSIKDVDEYGKLVSKATVKVRASRKIDEILNELMNIVNNKNE
jgi:ribosomal protein L7/L12